MDGCDPEFGVFHIPTNVDDGNPCTIDACDPLTGIISHNSVNADDGDVCTTDACDSVTGPSHTPINIDDNDVCTTDACDSFTGPSHTPISIDDNDVCTTDGCNSVTGVSHTPVNTDDGNACTSDACDSVTGVSHTPVNTDDGDACTTDGCNSVTGIFHTQICAVTFHSKIFIQGFYSGGGLMEVGGTGYLNLSGVSADPLDVDTIFLSAMDPVTHIEVDRKYGILKTNGNVSVNFGPSVLAGNSYFIKINHRNSLETWSALPVLFSSSTTYLFTTSSSMAFGDVMFETKDNMGWAIYNGDLNQDFTIDAIDFLVLDPSIQNGDGGYMQTDLNGDGTVDAIDFLNLDPNIQNGIGAAIP